MCTHRARESFAQEDRERATYWKEYGSGHEAFPGGHIDERESKVVDIEHYPTGFSVYCRNASIRKQSSVAYRFNVK
jgi:hypothetical protein